MYFILSQEECNLKDFYNCKITNVKIIYLNNSWYICSDVFSQSPIITKSKSAMPQSPSLPVYAQTLAEIENQLLKKKPVRVVTAEDLERELRGEVVSPKKREELSIRQPGPFHLQQQQRIPFSMPVPIPPIQRTVVQSIPQVWVILLWFGHVELWQSLYFFLFSVMKIFCSYNKLQELFYFSTICNSIIFLKYIL